MTESSGHNYVCGKIIENDHRLIKYNVHKQGGGCVSSLKAGIPHCVATTDTSVNPITLSLSAVAHT